MKTESKSIPCNKCKTRQTVTYPANAKEASWICQMDFCQEPNTVKLKPGKKNLVKDDAM